VRLRKLAGAVAAVAVVLLLRWIGGKVAVSERTGLLQEGWTQHAERLQAK